MEAREGIEPPHGAFAELRITTLLPRQTVKEQNYAVGLDHRWTIDFHVVSADRTDRNCRRYVIVTDDELLGTYPLDFQELNCAVWVGTVHVIAR